MLFKFGYLFFKKIFFFGIILSVADKFFLSQQIFTVILINGFFLNACFSGVLLPDVFFQFHLHV